MSEAVQWRLLPFPAAPRDAVTAFARNTWARLRAVTPLRAGREVLAILVIVVLDVYPGWWAENPTPPLMVALALAAASAGIYLLRLCFPAIALLIGVAVVIPGEYGGPVLLLMLGYAAGYRVASWQRALFTAVLALVLHVLLWNMPALSGPYAVLIMVTVFGMVIALPFLVGRYIAQRAAFVAAMEEREERTRREHAMLTRQVRLRERGRIAQDMHDSLGHRLSLISVHAGALALDSELGERQREAVQVLRSAALTGMEELRAVIGVLRSDDQPDDDTARRTAEAIDELVEGARRAGVRVSLVRGGQPCELPARVSHAAYRVVQEGLTNASKHAPGATVQVTVKYEPDALVVEVRNNPTRAPVHAKGAGVGLIGLGERVRLAGGMAHVGPLPTGGFRLAAVLPYEETGVAGEPVEELEPEPAKRPKRIRKWAGVGSIVAAGAVVVVVIGGFTYLGSPPFSNVITRQLYDSITVGHSENDVMGRLPTGMMPPIDDLTSAAPPEPPGSRCVYRVADEQSFTSGTNKIVRFCFADGKLVEKNTHEQRIP